MSLGLPGASLDPQQADNFEDVSRAHKHLERFTDMHTDGETVCCKRLATSSQVCLSASSLFAMVQSPTEYGLQQLCNTCLSIGPYLRKRRAQHCG